MSKQQHIDNPINFHQKSKTHSMKNNMYKSLSKITLYQKHWDFYLRQVLDLAETTIEFQNIQFNASSQTKKLALRQTFLLKKQLILCIVNKEDQETIEKLSNLLKMILNDKERQKIECFILFIKIKIHIVNIKYSYHKKTLKIFQQNIPGWLFKYDGCINTIYAKFFTLMSLHILKIEGILMKQFQQVIVTKTIDLKKKQFMRYEDDENKLRILKSLLFISFELYKIINILKKDPHMIEFYYNQITTFISIYKTKFLGYDRFQRDFQIQQYLKKRIPVFLQLNIYEDSKIKRTLSLQNTKNKLLGQQKPLPSKLIINSKNNNPDKKLIIQRSENVRREFRRKISSNKQSIIIQNFLQQQNEKQQIQNHQKQKILQYNQINPKQFTFQFCFNHSFKQFVGSFQITFADAFKYINFKIKIKDNLSVPYIVKINSIKNILEEVKYSNLCKLIWKITKFILNEKDCFFVSIYGNKLDDHIIPLYVDRQDTLGLLSNISQLLSKKFRNLTLKESMNGQSFKVQTVTTAQVNQFLRTLIEPKKIFAKRIGFINKIENSKAKILNKQLRYIKFIYFEENGFKIIQLKFLKLIFKEIFIFSLSPCLITKQLESRLSQLMYNPPIKFFHKYFYYVLNKFGKSNIQQRKDFEQLGDHNVQEQLQVADGTILASCQSKIFKDYFLSKNKSQIHSKPCQKVSYLVENKYFLSKKIQFKHCIKYFTSKFQIFQLKERQQNIRPSYKRIRMYRSIIYEPKHQIKFAFKISLSRVQPEKKPQKKQQKIYTKLLKHKIFKSKNNYIIMQEYQIVSENLYGYQFILHNKSLKYGLLSQNQIVHFDFDLDNKLVNSQKVTKFINKHPLSQMSAFYQQSRYQDDFISEMSQ